MRPPISRFVALVGLAVAIGALSLGGTASAAAPSNDIFANATVISSLPFSDTVDTTQATTDSDDAPAATACGVSIPPNDNSVWYDYTPSSNQTVTIDTAGSSYNPGVAVLTGSPSTGFSSVSCFLGSSQVSLLAGQTYHIAGVDFYGAGGGTLHLSISEITPLAADFTIDRFGSFDPRTGVATVRGTATCSHGAYAFVGLSLAQAVGRIATINGSGYAYVADCDGSPHPWSAEVQPASGGRFAGGHATVSANLFACNGFECTYDSSQREVTLRR